MNQQISNAPLFSASDALPGPEAKALSAYLDSLHQVGLLGMPESQAVAYLARLTQEFRPEVLVACALALRAPRFGHVCLDLTQPLLTLQEDPELLDLTDDVKEGIALPEFSEWRSLLASSPLISTHPQATDHPFVLRENLLYTQRYFVYECQLATQMLERASRDLESPPAPEVYPEHFEALFPSDKDQAGRQALSAGLSLLKPLTVIS